MRLRAHPPAVAGGGRRGLECRRPGEEGRRCPPRYARLYDCSEDVLVSQTPQSQTYYSVDRSEIVRVWRLHASAGLGSKPGVAAWPGSWAAGPHGRRHWRLLQRGVVIAERNGQGQNRTADTRIFSRHERRGLTGTTGHHRALHVTTSALRPPPPAAVAPLVPASAHWSGGHSGDNLFARAVNSPLQSSPTKFHLSDFRGLVAYVADKSAQPIRRCSSRVPRQDHQRRSSKSGGSARPS